MTTPPPSGSADTRTSDSATTASSSASGSSGPAEVEPEPQATASLFPADRLELARSFTAELAARGEELGLIGPLELPRIWTRHVLNCAVVAPLMSGRVADIGSGAGLPGIVLAIARPDVHFTLIEPMERRTDWLSSEAERLGLDNIEVLRARAEDVPASSGFDQVTARAVSSLTKLIPITTRLARAGGELVFMKGARVDDEVIAAEKAIRKFKLTDVATVVLGEGVLTETTRVFRATVRG
jgi:16S rRNA (guanine527-N7)-methyltransferase